MKSARELYRERPRSRLARASAAAIAALLVLAWSSDAIDFSALSSERGTRNLERFLVEVRPHPLQGEDWSWPVAGRWLLEQTRGRAGRAVLDTLALSVLAAVLAGLLALVASLGAARNLSTPEPFLPGPRRPATPVRVGFSVLVWTVRSALILLRAIPEYLWGFLLLVLLGPGALPAVLALALHNGGILGKLFAEVSEDVDPGPSRALRALGASRLSTATTALWPECLPRFLLFFFYRWETCVREATVLGLLGFAGIGYYILQAQAAIRWDEMLLWIGMGSALILAGDLLSFWLRSRLRRAGVAPG